VAVAKGSASAADVDGGLSPARRRVLSAFVTALVALAIAGSLWPRVFWERFHEAGLHQSWDVFAPDPIHQETVFSVLVTFADGTTTTWRPQRASAAFAARSNRWELWEDRLLRDEYSPWWDDAARFVAEQLRGEGRTPVRVALLRRWSDLPPPGMDPTLRAWNEFEFYAVDL
jgi:hypothetical protein